MRLCRLSVFTKMLFVSLVQYNMKEEIKSIDQKIEELENEMAQANFWENKVEAQAKVRELNELKNKKEELVFYGIENSFTNLHMIESSVKDKNGEIISNNYPKYVLNNGHIFSVADYQNVIKQALIKLRFQHIYNKKQ